MKEKYLLGLEGVLELIQDDSSMCSICYQDVPRGSKVYINLKDNLVCLDCLSDISLKEIQKNEAIKRMKKIGLFDRVIEELQYEGVINKSVSNGALCWLSDEEKEMIRKWEEETGNLAYHVILNHTNFGELLSVFHVSKHTKEWEMDRESLKEGLTVAYVINLDYDYSSELGYIGFESKNGGMVRVS